MAASSRTRSERRAAPAPAVHLLDTNSIIEAVRTGCWNSITGSLRIEAVAECRDECLRGDRFSSGYVAVSHADLARLAAVHEVSEVERSALLLVPSAAALNSGELDLFAHAHVRGDEAWFVCSPDGASVQVGVALGLGDRLIRLGELVRLSGARPDPPLRSHFETAWLSRERTGALMRRL